MHPALCRRIAKMLADFTLIYYAVFVQQSFTNLNKIQKLKQLCLNDEASRSSNCLHSSQVSAVTLAHV